MKFMILIIVIAVQYYARFNSPLRTAAWPKRYFDFLQSRLKSLQSANGTIAASLLAIPPAVVAWIVILACTKILGSVGFFAANLILVWYFIDASHPNKRKVNNVLEDIYQHFFAPIFWFMLLGGFGLVLYYMVVKIFELRDATEDAPAYVKVLNQIHQLMDWIPVRLLGLAFAIVGHFAPTFALWLKDALKKPSQNDKVLVSWALTALDLSGLDLTGTKSSEDENVTEAKLNQSLSLLLIHAALTWMAVLALFSIGALVG